MASPLRTTLSRVLSFVGFLAAATAHGAPGPPPAGCDGLPGTWCDVTGPACTTLAGPPRNTPCGERAGTSWVFDEGSSCLGCPYVFYVLVECGREMHLPLTDAELMDLRVTELATGRAQPLRCVNETAWAEAAGRPPRPIVGMECDGLPGIEEWWVPAFDATDGAGPGEVAWGDPSCPDLVSAYDGDGDGIVECGELPPGGGVLDRLGPGDEQVMDCFLEAGTGLCGLFRVEIASGSGAWSLFANCDGSGNPGFDVFADCTEAWAAWDPRPELVVEDLVVTGSCPDVTVGVTVRNIGCAAVPAGAEVEVVTDCPVPDVARPVLAVALAPGDSSRLDVPLAVSCPSPSVTVTVDPGNAVAECTESPGVAACRADAGADTLTAPACGCVPATIADAGPDLSACGDAAITLGGAVTAGACAATEHRWLDATTGTELAPWSASADSPPFMPDCSAPRDYVFETRCAGTADCASSDTVSVTCGQRLDCTPFGDGSCRSRDARAALNCGCRSNTLFMDRDTSADADGNGDPADDHDIELACNVLVTYPAPGFYTFRTWYVNGGCTWWVDALVDVEVFPLQPQPVATAGCPGDPVTLDCGVRQPGTNYSWDLDLSVDSDGNGVAWDDVDAVGCVVSAPYPDGTFTARSVAVEDGEPTCMSDATVTFDVQASTGAGPEVSGLRLARAGSALALTWTPLAGMDSYRVVRGDVGAWYGHLADDPSGVGACTTLVPSLTDADDAAPGGPARYYLVGAVGCGLGLGPLGSASDGTPRPAPLPTASCP